MAAPKESLVRETRDRQRPFELRGQRQAIPGKGRRRKVAPPKIPAGEITAAPDERRSHHSYRILGIRATGTPPPGGAPSPPNPAWSKTDSQRSFALLEERENSCRGFVLDFLLAAPPGRGPKRLASAQRLLKGGQKKRRQGNFLSTTKGLRGETSPGVHFTARRVIPQLRNLVFGRVDLEGFILIGYLTCHDAHPPRFRGNWGGKLRDESPQTAAPKSPP